MIKINVLIGLPASGKSYFAKEYSKPKYIYESPKAIVFDFDKLCKNSTFEKTLSKMLKDIKKDKEYIIDGLFLKNETYLKIIENFKDIEDVKIIFHYWEPDIEACLFNDLNRRDENSSITIKNANIEEPNKKLLGENIKIIKHIVKRKSMYQLFKDKYNLKDIIKSQKWSLGGDWRDCWGGGGTISASPQPATFDEFDKLIEFICPHINFMKYKKLFSEVVRTNSSNEGDYYGGCENFANFECDTENLYNALNNMGLIDTDSLYET